jgi:hypothetical protein
VHDVERHGGYISAAISSGGETLGFYFEPTPDCEAMLQESAELFYRKFGHLGTLRQEERECVPVGINRIRAWTRRFPTPRNLPILPSLPATFREIHSDSDLVLVRGNFPLSRLVYFAGGRDAVAFLPNIPVCQPHIEQGAGFMQYKRVTQEIIWLGAAAERCQILGLARPLIASEPESQAESGTEPDG